MESMANGTPAILTRVNGAEELVEDGINSIIIEPRDPVMISKELDHYFGDKTDRASMSKNARERIKEKFTTEVMCSKLEHIFFKQLGDKA